MNRRIALGLMGDARGHVSRAVALAKSLPDCEFLFIGGGRVRELAAFGAVLETPLLATVIEGHSISFAGTAWTTISQIHKRRNALARTADALERFGPDLVLVDYEYFTPRAAAMIGLTSVGVDNQHLLTLADLPKPREAPLSRLLTTAVIRLMYSKPERMLIPSFIPERRPLTPGVEFFPPLIDPSLRALPVADNGFALAYLRRHSKDGIPPLLRSLPRPVLVYGLGEAPPSGNLVFKDGPEFHRDLAESSYVVSHCGHSLIAEALFFGKPVFGIPVRNSYEQWFNAFHLRRLGFGDFARRADEAPGRLRDFEDRLDERRRSVAAGDFDGSGRLIARIRELAGHPPDISLAGTTIHPQPSSASPAS